MMMMMMMIDNPGDDLSVPDSLLSHKFSIRFQIVYSWWIRNGREQNAQKAPPKPSTSTSTSSMSFTSPFHKAGVEKLLKKWQAIKRLFFFFFRFISFFFDAKKKPVGHYNTKCFHSKGFWERTPRPLGGYTPTVRTKGTGDVMRWNSLQEPCCSW